jgi:2-methylisocitrate lyase-like PEP mutase family enzyme
LPNIRAAAAARRDKDFVIIARTDSRAVLGFEEAVRRGNAALDAGADVVFLEAPQTMDEIAAVPKQIKGPCLLNVVQGGKTPRVTMADAQQLGYAIAIVPGLMTRTVLAACEGVLTVLKDKGEVVDIAGGPQSVKEYFRRFGADAWDARRTAFRPGARRAAE